MKRKASAPILALLIASFLIPLVVEAQAPEPPDVDTLGPVVFSYQSGNVVILSPRNSTNYAKTIQLIFAVEATGMFGQFGNVGVSLDGGVINSVTDFIRKSVVQSGPEWYWYQTTALASITLPNLSEGAHSVTVYYGWQYLGIPENPSLQRYEVFAHATVDFMVVNAEATNVSDAVSDIANYTKPEISIASPLNKTFNTLPLPLSFTVSYRYPIASNVAIHYSIDGKDNIAISSTIGSSTKSGERIFTPYNLEINNLFDGSHNLTVYAKITYFHYGSSSTSSSVEFTIDTSPPTISGLSIVNKTYDTNTIPLNFTINEPASKITYSLDGEANVTITGNTTLSNLSYGTHNITVYATDAAGNKGSSETVHFIIAKPFPTVLVVAASAVSAAVIGAGILFYLVKIKKSIVSQKPR
jgi:hypothetical protein